MNAPRWFWWVLAGSLVIMTAAAVAKVVVDFRTSRYTTRANSLAVFDRWQGAWCSFDAGADRAGCVKVPRRVVADPEAAR